MYLPRKINLCCYEVLKSCLKYIASSRWWLLFFYKERWNATDIQMYLMRNNRTEISNSLGISLGCKGQKAITNKLEQNQGFIIKVRRHLTQPQDRDEAVSLGQLTQRSYTMGGLVLLLYKSDSFAWVFSCLPFAGTPTFSMWSLRAPLGFMASSLEHVPFSLSQV